MRIVSIITTISLTLTFFPAPAIAFNQSSAVSYLKSSSIDDWTIMALASSNSLAGVNTGFLNSDPGNKATDIEKRMLARAAAGLDDNGLINQLATLFNGTEIGAGQGLLNDDIFGLLALAAYNTDPVLRQKLAEFIKQNQNSDGGWGFAHAPTSSDSNDTAMAIMALLANGESSSSASINRGFDYIASTKKSSGYAFSANFSADTASTAWVVSTLNSAGRSVPSSAVEYLKSQQQSNGSFAWQSGSSGTPLMTAYAVIALNNATYPVRGLSGGGNGGGSGDNGSSGGGNPSSNVGGRVVDQFGRGVSRAVIDTCHHGVVETDAEGRWQILLPAHTALCARVVELPLGFSGATSTNNTPETQDANTYEFQITAQFCREISGCVSEEIKWDIADDQAMDFRAQRTAVMIPNPPVTPPPATPPPLPEQTFDLAVISPAKVEFIGQLNLANTTALSALTDSGLRHKVTNTSLGPFVESVAGFASAGTSGWMYAVNGAKPSVGASEFRLKNSDQLIWFYDNFAAGPPPFPGEGESETYQQTVTLTAEIINPPPPPVPPSVSIQLSKPKIKIGESVTITWSSQNATQVVSSTPNNWAKSDLSGSITIQPIQTTTYSIVLNGSPLAEASATIEVDRTPSVVFGISNSSANFGQLEPGQSSSPKSITLQNSSNSSLEITTTLQQNTELFRRGLKINSQNYNQYKEQLSAGQSKNVGLSLEVPSDYASPGRVNDTLIFWASIK